MSLTETSVHVSPKQGERVRVLGNLYTFKITSQETNGTYALWETETEPETPGAPPHIHHQEAESFFVLEGELAVDLGGESISASAGSFVHIPAGVVHTFRNAGSTTARFLGLVVPGGFEQFFLEVGQPAESAQDDEPPDIEGIIQTAAKYHCEILPPPGG